MPLDNFVKTVMAHTVSGSWRELAEIHRKAIYDVLERSTAQLDDLLLTLTVDRYSMSVVSVLLAKMNHSYTDALKDKFERTLSQVESMLPLLDSTQISYIPDIYVTLFRKVYECCLLQIKKPSRGIMLLSNAIKGLIKERNVLTSLHPCLFCLCLKARIHDPALPFIHLAISKIFKETPVLQTPNQAGPYMDPKWVLLYFYYGGLIYAVLGRYEEAFVMMQKVSCMPAVAVSAIMVQAYKKYVLLSLLLHEKIVPLPNYRSAAIVRNVAASCTKYTGLERIFNNEEEDYDKANAVLEYLEAHRATFEGDKNVGLVKHVARRIREKSIVRLTQCFISLSLSDVVRRCHLDDCDHAEDYLLDMSKTGEIHVRIDKKHGTVYFDEVKAEASESKVDEAASRVYMLDKLMKQFDDLIRVSPAYISRVGRPMLLRGGGVVPPDEGLGYLGCAFAPPSSVIESAASRPMDMLD